MTAAMILNDGARTLDIMGTGGSRGIYLVEFNPPIGLVENTYTESAFGDGKRRIRSRQNNSENSSFKVGIGGTTEAEFWGYVDEWQEMVASMHRQRGTIRYTPPRNGTPVTFELESMEVSELPQDGAWLNRLFQSESTAAFEARPGGLLDPAALFSTSFSGPIAGATVAGVGGHLRARGELILTEGSALPRGLVEVGIQEGFDPASPEPLLLNLSSGLTATGFTGASNSGASGKYSTTVVRGKATANPTVLCSTTPQPHKGLWRPKLRVYSDTAGVRVRFAWKIGDGPISRGLWQDIPGPLQFYDIDVGPILIGELPTGHSWTGYVEYYSPSGSALFDLDFIQLMPADVYSKGRAPILAATPAAFVAWEEFETLLTAGLTGQASDSGPIWTLLPQGAGDVPDTTDYSVQAVAGAPGEQQAVRSMQANTFPRLLSLGTAVYTSTIWRSTVFVRYAFSQSGIFVRGTDMANYVTVYRWDSKVRLIRNKGNVQKLIWESPRSYPANTGVDIQVQINSDGTWLLWIGATPAGSFNGVPPTAQGYESDFAAGALASGKVGLFDFCGTTAASPIDRQWDHMSLATPPADAVVFPSRTARLRWDAFRRQNVSGSSEGRVPQPEGSYLTLPPDTRAAMKSRIVVAQRSLDTDSGLPSLGMSLSLSGSLTVTERITLLAVALPTGFPIYTISNLTTDRTIDCNSTTLNELCDVLATLITDYPLPVGAFTFTNATTDRSLDCNSTSENELADVLATVYADLVGAGGSYTITNPTTRRFLDCDSASMNDYADILATFISDLVTAGDL